MIVEAELIEPFDAPDYQIRRDNRLCDANDIELLNVALRNGRARIIANEITSQPPFTHILRYFYEDAATDFLVRIDTSGYAVRYESQVPE